MRLRKLEDGAIALITGASSGIGAALAEQLVERGARVIAAARRGERLAALAKRLGAKCLPLELDVTDPGVAGLVERLPAEWRAIDILVNNAGHDIGGKVAFEKGAVEDWASIIATNVAGLVRVSHAVIPGMLERGSGQVVNIGSTSGVNPVPTEAVYAATKFAVNGLTKTLRLEYLGKNPRLANPPGPGAHRVRRGPEARRPGERRRILRRRLGLSAAGGCGAQHRLRAVAAGACQRRGAAYTAG